MNNEIKEILDTFKWSVEQPDIDDEQLVLTGDLKKLLDYITNLQEEIKSANESIIWWQNRFNAVERENKKIKETNIYCNRTDCSGRIKDSRKYDSVYQEKEDYKSRCEKASEYIKENPARCWYDAKKKSEKFGDIEIINHQKILLDILQGSDK